MLWEPPYLHYNSESIQRTSEQSLDWRVWSWKRSLSYLQRRQRSWAAFGGGVRWGVGVERAHGSVRDCWKGLGIGSTPKHLWNWEAVGVCRMPKVSKVGVGKTLRCFWSRKEVVPWHFWSEKEVIPWQTPSMSSVPSPSLLTPVIGSAVLRWAEKIWLPIRTNVQGD